MNIGDIDMWPGRADTTAVWRWANQFPMLDNGICPGTYSRAWWVFEISPSLAIEIIQHQHDGQGGGYAGECEVIVEWLDPTTGKYL